MASLANLTVSKGRLPNMSNSNIIISRRLLILNNRIYALVARIYRCGNAGIIISRRLIILNDWVIYAWRSDLLSLWWFVKEVENFILFF